MDRLAQLQKLATESVVDEEPQETRVDDVVIQVQDVPPAKTSDVMTAFFTKINNIREKVNQIEEKIDLVAQKHKELLVEANSQKSAVINQQLHVTMDAVQKLSGSVKSDLQGIDKQNKLEAKSGVYEDGSVSTDLRIRQVQQASITKRFIKVMTRYNDVQAENKKKYTDAVRRQCHIYDENMSEDKIQMVIEQGTEGLFTGKRLEEAETALSKIKDRHEDLKNLERSLLELHEMFMDMAILVNEQGEMIEKIEFSVQQAHNYVRHGAVQVHKARIYQSKARHKKILCIVCLLVLIAIIVVIALVS